MKKCKYEDRYNDYYKLMLKRAFHYHSICGIEMEDALSIASLAFYEACKNYDPQKAVFSTYLWWTMENKFRQTFEFKTKSISKDVFKDKMCVRYDTRFNVILFFNDLSIESKRIICLSLQFSDRLLNNGAGRWAGGILPALRKLKKMLIINMEEGLIESCIKEIKQNLRSI